LNQPEFGSRRIGLRATVRRLPVGTVPVGGGVCALALASYVYLAIAGRTLSVDGLAGLSVLWSLAFSVGTGLFLPLEQELTRVVAARRAGGDGARPVALRGARLSAGLLLLCLVALAVFAHPLARLLFRGDLALVWGLWAAFVGLSVVHISRGLLAGSGRFRAYGGQLAIDSVLRLVFALGLSAAGSTSPLLFGLVLGVAPLLSVAILIHPVVDAARPGPGAGPGELRKGLAPLTLSTLLGQVLPNAPVVLAELVTEKGSALTGALLSAMIIIRLPIFAVTSIQPSILNALSRSFTLGARREFQRQLTRATAGAAVLGLGGMAATAVLGPWLTVLLFHAPRLLDAADFAMFSLGTAGLVLALVLSQGLLAMNRQLAQGSAWAFGAAVFTLLALLPGGVVERLESSYAGGCWVTALALAGSIGYRLRRWPEPAGAAAAVATSDSAPVVA
jgi:O-antigen/teichoic acid export membrane protein